MLPLPEPRQLLRKPGSVAGRKQNTKIKTEKYSSNNAPVDFLKQSFLPITDYSPFKNREIMRIQTSFFESLVNLSKLYEFTPYILEGQVFPYNIHAAFTHAKKVLKDLNNDLELMIIETDTNPASIATTKEIEIGQSLFYVPSEPLMYLHSKKNAKTFSLLLSIYAYLNQCAGMPLTSQNDYMQNNYDMIEEWLENDFEMEDKELAESKREFRSINRKAAILEKAIKRKDNLKNFRKRIRSYKPSDHAEGSLLAVAEKFAALYKKFPKAHFMQNIVPKESEYDYDDFDQYPIYPEQYFSFCWSTKGWMFNHLIQIVNCDLQECTVCEQPGSVQHFDTPQLKENHPLDFEDGLLDLISELFDILENFYDEKYNDTV